MKLFRSLSAALVDSGLAALSTFAIGLYAARYLDPGTLGVFALHFAAFTMVATFTHQGVFIPLEALASRTAHGIYLIKRAFTLAWVPALISPLVVLLPVIAAPQSVLIPMGLSAALATFLSPIQDHVRRMLHLGESSSQAVAMSAIQLAAVVAGVVVLPSYVSSVAVPFAALAGANAMSLAYGVTTALLLVRRADPPLGEEDWVPSLGELLSSGKWLVTGRVTASAAAFAAAALLGRLTSIETLGVADAARIVGRPIFVVTTGMTAVLGPRLMSAAAKAREQEGSRVGRIYHVAVVGCVFFFLAAFGWDHPYNPLARLVPLAFSVPMLVAVTVVANGMHGFFLPSRFEAIGAGRTAALLRVEAQAGVAQVLAASFALVLHAYSLAIAMAVFAVVRGRGLRRVRGQVYGEKSAAPASALMGSMAWSTRATRSS